MLDLHIEGAAPVTLLVRDESRSTRSTSVNKEDDLDPLLDFQDASFSSAASPSMHDKGKQRQQLLNNMLKQEPNTINASICKSF